MDFIVTAFFLLVLVGGPIIGIIWFMWACASLMNDLTGKR